MANFFLWYDTEIPDQLLENLREESENHAFDTSKVAEGGINKSIRNSSVQWMSSDHWIAGFCMHYILKANRINFMYDIDGIEGEGLQYSKYHVGGHYSWHSDTSIEQYYTSQSKNNLDDNDPNCAFNSTRANDLIAGHVERPRKLSFSLQLTDHNDYEGGNLQFQSEANLKIHNAPRKRGTIIIFDSRIRHRVTKVRSGRRDSLVGWVTGPRWR